MLKRPEHVRRAARRRDPDQRVGGGQVGEIGGVERVLRALDRLGQRGRPAGDHAAHEVGAERRPALGRVEHAEPPGRPGAGVYQAAAALKPRGDRLGRRRDPRDRRRHRGVRLALGGDEQRDDLADRPCVEVVQVWPHGLGGERVEPVRGGGRLHADHVRLVDRPQPQRAVERVAGGRHEVELLAQRLDPRQAADQRHRAIPGRAGGRGERLGGDADDRQRRGVALRNEDVGREGRECCGTGELRGPGLRRAEAGAGGVEQRGGRAAAVVGAQRRAQPGGADPRAAALVAQPGAPAVGGPQRAVRAYRERHDAGARDQHDARLSVQRARVRDHGVAGHRDALRPQRGQQRIAQRARRVRGRQRPGGAHDHLVDRAEFAGDGQDRRLRGPHAAPRRESWRARPLGPAAACRGPAGRLAEVDGEDHRTHPFMSQPQRGASRSMAVAPSTTRKLNRQPLE